MIDSTLRMPYVGAWLRIWFYFGLLCNLSKSVRPRFDTSTDMRLVLIPADAEVGSVIFRLRATDQDADYPLIFEVTATITPVVRIDNLPCTLYNKVCQANVILIKRLIPGRLHDFAVRVRDTKGDSNCMQATISVTNTTTSRDKIFPHIPSLIMVPEDTKPGTELDYILVRANIWNSITVYIELWQPQELFAITQQHTETQTRGVITLIGELDFEKQSMYTLTIYATDPYTEREKDTRNIAGLNIVVIVQDVQDEKPIFTLAPPLTTLNDSVQPGDIILRVHAEDGDKGVPREITYGLIPEGNPFVPFFNISQTTGEITLVRPLEELTQITRINAPILLRVVAVEIRKSTDEPQAGEQDVQVGFILGESGNSPPFFENNSYVASIPENLKPGTMITFTEQYSTKVHDKNIGKAGVFALKLENNNGTFEINPTVAERTADFIIMVRDNMLIDYETYKSLTFKIIAQEVGPATNLSASAEVVMFIQDVNDNPPVFSEESYEVTLSENITAGTRVTQVHATDKDTGIYGNIKYTGIIGWGNEAFLIDPDIGLITVVMGSFLDREMAAQLQLTVQAQDENGKGNQGIVPLTVNLLDVNDNTPIFDKDIYEFMLNFDLTNFTTTAIIKATDADAEPPNNEIRYELIHGNYENKFYLNEITGELILRSPVTKFRRKKQSTYDDFPKQLNKAFHQSEHTLNKINIKTSIHLDVINSSDNTSNQIRLERQISEIKKHRRKREESNILYTLTARAYDLGVPHLASETQIKISKSTAMEDRIMMFVVQGEHLNLTKTAETLATITGGKVTILNTHPYTSNNQTGLIDNTMANGKRTIVVARVQQTEPGAPLVDVEKIRHTLAANGVGIINGTSTTNMSMTHSYDVTTKLPIGAIIHDGKHDSDTTINRTVSNSHEEVTVYKAENKLLFWLLIILGLLMLLAIAAIIICCICPGCPFYMAPRKRRTYSSEKLIDRPNGRPKRHLHRKPMATTSGTLNEKKQAWSADPTRRNWQFNRRNIKNGGLASLPGDIVYISEQTDQTNIGRLRDEYIYDLSRRKQVEEQRKMYVDDIEKRKIKDYNVSDADFSQRREMTRDVDITRDDYRQRYLDAETDSDPAIREQLFYREGNAEVLQLVTRGQVEDNDSSQRQSGYPVTVIVDGKDVLLQRFMEDQKTRHEASMQESEMARTVDSHQRQKNFYQHRQEIILLPDDLEIRHRHTEELEHDAQKLVMDDGYEMQKVNMESQAPDIRCQEISMTLFGIPPPPPPAATDKPSISKEQMQSASLHTFHDLELAKQNALLTRLLLERDARHVGAAMMDSGSYLETQSLPGQVAIATQTDKVAATQTERHIKSRSDNDESDKDLRNRKKIKSKKHYDESNSSKRIRTLLLKSPIEKEENQSFDKRLSKIRKKVKDMKDGRKESLELQILREISDSLDENDVYRPEKEAMTTKTHKKSTEDDKIRYAVLSEEKDTSSSSIETCKKHEGTSNEDTCQEARTISQPEVSVDGRRCIRETTEKKISRKESTLKRQKTVESIMKPSFRVLEREITMLTKKLSKLADKKMQRTSKDGSTSPEQSKMLSKDSSKDFNQGLSKKTEELQKGQKQLFKARAAVPKEPGITEMRQKFRYQQPQVISTGSSEYDDAFERLNRKVKLKEAEKYERTAKTHYRQPGIKKQTHIKRKESQKHVIEQDFEKYTDIVDKKVSKMKSRNAIEFLSRAEKLTTISRRRNLLSKEPGTSTDSNKMYDKKIGKLSEKSTESSEIPSNHSDRQKATDKLDFTSDGFSDNFTRNLQDENIKQRDAFYIVDTKMDKQDKTIDGKRIKVIQQFSDNFSTDTQAGNDMEHQVSDTIVDKIQQDPTREFNQEVSTQREIPEDIVIFDNLGYIESEIESVLDTVRMKRESSANGKIPESSNLKKHDRTSNGIISLDSTALKISEEYPIDYSLYRDKPAVEKRLDFTSGKYKKGIEETYGETEAGILTETEDVLKEYIQECETVDNVDEIAKEVNISKDHIEEEKISNDVLDYVTQEPENKEDNEFKLVGKTEEDIENDIEDYAYSLSRIEEDKTVKSSVIESTEEEEIKSKLRKYNEDEILMSEKILDDGIQRDLTRNETEDESLGEVKSEIDRDEMKITTTDINVHQYQSHQYVTSKPRYSSKEYETQESDLEDLEKEIESTMDTFQYMAKEKELNDEATQELSKDKSIHSELDQVRDVTRETIEIDKPKSWNGDLSAGMITIEDYQTKEESYAYPEEIRYHQETEFDDAKESIVLDEVTTSIEEITHEEQSQEESHEDKESLKVEEDATKILEILEERSTESLRDLTPGTSISDELDKKNGFEGVIENIGSAEDLQDKDEQQGNVSVELFTGFLDTVEVSEDSDSSSDISRKTTLSVKPYETPRHREKLQQESFQDTGTIGPERDTDNDSLVDKVDGNTIHLASQKTVVDEEKKDLATTSVQDLSDNEKVSFLPDVEKVSDQSEQQDYGFESEKFIEIYSKEDVKDSCTRVQDEITPTQMIKALNGTTEENAESESITMKREDTEYKNNIAENYENIEDLSKTIKQDKRSEIVLVSSKTEQADQKIEKTKTEIIKTDETRGTDTDVSMDKTKTKDAKTKKTKIEDTEMDKMKTKDGKTKTLSTSGKRITETKPSVSTISQKTKSKQSKILSRGKKKDSCDVEKVTSVHDQSRKYSVEKQTDADRSQKVLRKEVETHRKQLLPKSQFKQGKKVSRTLVRHGEIDVNKAQSKYMAWYNKKHDEAERRKLEKQVMEDDEQLPRWLSRTLKGYKTKQRERQIKDMTPRTRRKIKPLVNVESEQLKAIVRQGRELRRAEGSFRDDPSIEIFARTPPITSTTQHHLTQHSEYKYEKAPPPFYLHPPPAPHPSPQLSPERFKLHPSTSQFRQSETELDSDNVVSLQSGSRLRHQQLLEKKSVFDIAYSEAAPSQLRSDSATPPS